MPRLASLLVTETKAQIYERGLALAQSLGLRVTSWAPGDPTRSLYHFAAQILSTLEANVAGYVASGFLDHARGDWLTLLAEQVYGVERIEATYASTKLTLTNGGGGLYVIEPGDVVAKNSTTGATYTNTSGGTLPPWSGSGPKPTLEIDIVADEPGSDGSAQAGEIDELVTTLLNVTCSNTNAALGLDEEEDEPLRDRCRAKLGTLSPNGPRDAYVYVVRSSELTGSSEITRARSVGDSTTGDVDVYVAGASGPVSSGAVAGAQAAVEQWAAPLCITPTVHNTTGVTVDLEYEAWIYASVGEDTDTIKARHAEDLAAMFAVRPIGGDIIAPASAGALYKSLIEATIKASYPDHTFRVVVGTPSSDVALAIDEVPVLGTITCDIHLELDP